MLTVDALSKTFGDVRAVDEVSFSVRAGEVYGLLGENGAGKTTTLRMLATMLKPTGGGATVCGHPIDSEPAAVRGSIGILFGGEAGLYDRLTGRENILYFADLNDVPRREALGRIDAFTKAFAVGEYLGKPAGKLSKGNRQKMAFMRALIHNPAVMLLDEPSSGMDVGGIDELHRFILACQGEGKAIVLSSHTMSEVEKLCDRVGILHRGRMMDQGTKDELLGRNGCASIEEVFLKLTGGRVQ